MLDNQKGHGCRRLKQIYVPKVPVICNYLGAPDLWVLNSMLIGKNMLPNHGRSVGFGSAENLWCFQEVEIQRSAMWHCIPPSFEALILQSSIYFAFFRWATC